MPSALDELLPPTDSFAGRHIGPSRAEEDAMLAALGVPSLDALIDQTVPARIRTRALLILQVILLGFGAITFSLWVGGHDVLAGRITGGDLSAFVFYAVLLASSGATMSEI